MHASKKSGLRFCSTFKVSELFSCRLPSNFYITLLTPVETKCVPRKGQGYSLCTRRAIVMHESTASNELTVNGRIDGKVVC